MGNGDGVGDGTLEKVTGQVTKKGRGFGLGFGDWVLGMWRSMWITWERGRKRLRGKGVEKFVGKLGVFRGENEGIFEAFWRGILGQFWVVFRGKF